MELDDWFLTAPERGNDQSTVDERHQSGSAWTEGNEVLFLIDGATYFEHLAQAFDALEPGDQLRFTDWRSDFDERLVPGGGTIGDRMTEACRRGVDVRGLLWRSHSDSLAFSAKENRRFASLITESGGEVLLDERVRRGGSHHQKLLIFRHLARPELDVAFVGGIDLSHGRHDDGAHDGDHQVIKLDERYSARPPWHDVQLEVRGPAISDLDITFRERWQDPTPLNYSGPLRARVSRATSRDRVATPLPPALPDPRERGSHAVQVLRTYPVRRLHYPFAPTGERSVARAFTKAVDRARGLIYLEDQYFWSAEIAKILARALRRHHTLQLIIVVPRYPDKDGILSGPPSRFAQQRAIAIVKAAGGERVGIYDLHNEAGVPIYVHAKVCIIDDIWATVGSDNLNRRSWTHDSELSCAVIDEELDMRAPRDPGALGDGSRRFARDLRIGLWAEHLGRSPDDPTLIDVGHACTLWRETAAATETKNSGESADSLRRIRIQPHVVDSVNGVMKPWAALAYRFVFDPDGRPFSLRLKNRF